ncbi:hypothetical protein [Motilimonas eburnea]|uniref:hypothetical protein n=1 Tax=Motilimonas eburnea TaxID=1737488 RepID=UPI001E377AC9|nr:hypothetical protein [Motilimonas eburnea]MCE2573031.1 hypothetical protein [Motilimonas eburnea]
MFKLRCVIGLALVCSTHAFSTASPESNPAQCPYPLSTVDRDDLAELMQQGIENCLLTTGNKNFTRSQHTLTIPTAKGKVRYVDKPSEFDTHRTYKYMGYDAKNDMHMVEGSGGEWRWQELIHHTKGYKYTLDGLLIDGGISPNAGWAMFTSGDHSCEHELYIGKLTVKNRQGQFTGVKDLTPLVSVCKNGLISKPFSVKWVSQSRARVEWSCEQNYQRVSKDETLLINKNGQWQADRLPCLGQATQQASTKKVNSKPETLVKGMSLTEVEQLFGGFAEAFLVDPLALLSESSITRIWTVNGAKLKVKFIDDKVESWTY